MRIKVATDTPPKQMVVGPREGGFTYSHNKGTERTMEIRKLFGQQQEAVQGSNARGKGADAYATQNEAEQAARAGVDRVSLSPLSRQLSQFAQILGEDEVRRSQRIAELKDSIEKGEYQVSSNDVAQSVVAFTAEGATSA